MTAERWTRRHSPHRSSPFLKGCSLRVPSFLLALLFLLPPAIAGAADLYDAKAIPHVSDKARDSYYQLFLNAGQHRAFAIAPGGAWAWVANKTSQQEAMQGALDSCSQQTQQICVIYARDDEVSFSRDEWRGLWGPYLTTQQAASAELGLSRGKRFPDLAFKTAEGRPIALSDLRGKLVMLHFWGSWCPPCLRELPSLDLFQRILRDRLGDEVAVVLLQVREPISNSHAWLQQQGLDGLPLFDSGATNSDDTQLVTRSGMKLPDRAIAKVFPSTYVLDSNGLVLFKHTGAILDWTEYLPFFEHAVKSKPH